VSTRLEDVSAIMLPEIENELHRSLECIDRGRAASLYGMLAYHLGWEGQQEGQKSSGKRIRPLLLLMVSSACGGNWQRALPAAAAIELVHNFSLIHDDIEDNDRTRRGRPTLWTKWGLPLALNAGDSMFALAHLALHGLQRNVPSEMALKVTYLLQQTCLRLTEGQHLDISYADQTDLEIDDYWPMVNAKTAALIAASAEIGALLGGANPQRQEMYRIFGEKLGLAFQVLDDFLGVWGDPHVTGKSAASDLSESKKSLPVLYGLSKQAEFARRWQNGISSAEDVFLLADLLAAEGARTYTHEVSVRLTDEALAALAAAAPQGEAGDALGELTHHLLHRNQ
jgi:geranylgeranyl diphosphate synthase type I